MQLDSEQDRAMLLQVMKQAQIPGAISAQFALLMNRVAAAPIVPPQPTVQAPDSPPQDPTSPGRTAKGQGRARR